MNLKNSTQMQAWGITLIRVILGIVFLAHGYIKLVSLGLAGFATYLAQLGIPVPAFSSGLSIAVEIIGGVALILGLFTRWVAIPLTINIAVALLTVHLANGFFYQTNGYEFTLVLLIGSIALILLGSGAASLDHLLSRTRYFARSLPSQKVI